MKIIVNDLDDNNDFENDERTIHNVGDVFYDKDLKKYFLVVVDTDDNTFGFINLGTSEYVHSDYRFKTLKEMDKNCKEDVLVGSVLKINNPLV